MESITATYADMKKAASDIDNLAESYETDYQKFLSEVETLTTTDWKGTDADAFRTKVSEFRDDFAKMKQLMNDYATFIRQTAIEYENTQNHVKQQASTLKS